MTHLARAFSTQRYAELIAALDLTDEHAAWLHDALTALPPHVCFRAMLLRDVRSYTRRHLGDAAGDDLGRFWQHLGIRNVYAMVHVSVVLLAVLKIADHAFPKTMHPVDKLYHCQRQIASEFVHINPLIQILYKACRDDLFEFVRMQIQGLDSWQNFGHATLEQPSSHQLVVHYDDFPTTLLGPGLRAIYEGTLELFTTPAHITFEVHDDAHATVHVQRH